jgi:putative nucleotidyltransferase with HDIG domain
VLVPDGARVYALVYRAVERRGGAPAVLQGVAVVADGDFAGGPSGDIRAVLRPFVVSADEPHVLTVDGRPRMVVNRPLMLGGRQLGTVTAAVPYDAEVRCAQGVLAAVVLVSAVSLLVMGALSYRLTGVAMVPLDKIRHYVSNHKAGQEVERLDVGADETINTILDAYQEMIDRSQEFADQLMKSNHALRELLTGSVGALVNAIEANDPYTAGHSERVADMACGIARELGWDHARVEQLRLGALLHDIGKIGINHAILNKPGPLDDDEWEMIRQHTVIGARILSAIPGCEEVGQIVLHHHERLDGTGYPDGLRDREIPLSARIVMIADIFDALTSKRSYRDAYPADQALGILTESAGDMVDPDLLDVFAGIVRRETGAEAAGELPERRPPAAVTQMIATTKE